MVASPERPGGESPLAPMGGAAIHKPASKRPNVLQFTEDLVDKGAYEQSAAMAEPDVAGAPSRRLVASMTSRPSTNPHSDKSSDGTRMYLHTILHAIGRRNALRPEGRKGKHNGTGFNRTQQKGLGPWQR